jgi:hypothetical protein
MRGISLGGTGGTYSPLFTQSPRGSLPKIGAFPYRKNPHFSLQPTAPNENARLIRTRLMAEWELVADDENTPNKVSPVRSSLRELPGTAQVFAKPGEPVPASSLLLRATTRTALSRRNDGITGMSRMGHSSFVIHSSFGIWPSAFSNNSHRKFPPNNFPGRPLLRPLDSTPPSWMAMGMVRPRQHSTQQLESSRNN